MANVLNPNGQSVFDSAGNLHILDGKYATYNLIRMETDRRVDVLYDDFKHTLSNSFHLVDTSKLDDYASTSLLELLFLRDNIN